MTTLDIPLLPPQVYTNATQDDLIWQKKSPEFEDPVLWRGQGSFSPPLKHITIQSTQELLENFDPLDVQDSASEKSTSSTDTMIMMTTEEERRNAEKIQISLRDHELRKSLEETNLKHLKFDDNTFIQRRSVPNNYVSCQQMFTNAKLSRDKLSLSGDDGYSTDSRSNTTASISSPLSSSLSSLSTYEGSPYSGSFNSSVTGPAIYNTAASNPNVNNSSMQRGPIQKGPNLHPNTRANVYKHGGHAVKRRDVHTETPDSASSLEERLRALTTIEEEDSGLPTAGTNRNGMGKFGIDLDPRNQQSPGPGSRSIGQGKRTIENPHFGGSANYDTAISGATGFFRAVPVTVVAAEPPTNLRPYPESGYYSSNNRGDTGDAYLKKSSGGGGTASPAPHVNGDGWKDYTRFFEKDTEIPLHNIDPAGRGKFSNSGVDDVPDMDINRQIGIGSPAHPRKQRFVTSRDGDRMVMMPGMSTSALPQIGQRDAEEPYDAPDRLSTARGNGNSSLRSETSLGNGSNSNVRGFNPNTRQHHVMSSMPDLRSQDPAWVAGPNSRNPHPSYQGYPYHYQQQQHPQQQLQQQQYHHHSHQQLPAYQTNAYPFYDQQQQYPQTVPTSASPYLNRQPEDALSMNFHDAANYIPQSSESENRPQSYPEVVLRRSRLTASARALPNRPDRASWHPTGSSDQQHLSELDRLKSGGLDNRSSLDLGSIPQLQKQIRATSELCLQASRRHMFASSADIYKLFQGQKKPPVPPPTKSSPEGFGSDIRNQGMRHSFHSMPTSMWSGSSQPGSNVQPAQDSPRTKPKLRVMMPPMSATGVSSPGPIRADHNINIPPEAWTSVTSLPASAEVDMDRFSIQRQTLSAQPDLDRPVFQRPGSASAELGIDRHSFQRQSSGYSSENELQQIESNARASKNLKKQHDKAPSFDQSGQQFIPLNRSIDHDSNTGTDNADDLTDNEPVYMNQSMLTRARTFDALNKPSGSEWGMQALPDVSHLQEQQQTFPVKIPESSTSATSYGNPHYSSNTYVTSTTHSNIVNRSNVSPFSGNITQNQIINFNSKPVTITSHVPSSPYTFQEKHNSTNKNNNNNNDIHAYALSPHGSFIGNVSAKSYSDHCRMGSQDYPVSHSGNNPYNPPMVNPSGSLPSQRDPSPFSPGAQPPRPRRTDSNSSAQLSPVEIAQLLDVPFATSIISDEQGDRLSTLV